ncbi:transposon protein, putative, CACTA, En/Spm sub-class [Hordeum vulgare]|nr:transposon protein, putative, CACTA, En/Spm sub-class [Hordeum vulgare]
MPNPGQSHMDVESNIRAEASSYHWNTVKSKTPLKNQDGDADDVDDLDMRVFAATIADFKGLVKYMIGYKDLPTIDADSKKYMYPGCKKKYSKLSATLALLRFRAANGLSNKGFTDLLGLVKEIILEDNVLPKSTNKEKKIVCPLEIVV